MSLTLIAAMTWPGRVIGKDNSIPWKLGEDLKRFKALTMGHPVVMGRKTWQSLPFKLPGRTNGVVSRQGSVPANARGESPDLLASSLEDALAQAALAPGGEAIFVIGGAQLYALALPRADRLALTQIQHPFEGDTLFPDLDLAQWTVTLHEAHHHEGDPSFDYLFLDLQRNASQGEP